MPPVEPLPEWLTTDELWYHYAATSRMYLEMGRPVPDNMRAWAREQVEMLRIMSYMDPSRYKRVPILKLLCVYGIRYGVHSQLESYYLATGKINHDNVSDVAERMAILFSVRDYITRFWDDLVLDLPTQVSPRIQRGDFHVRCSYAPLGGWGVLENTSRITASLYCDDVDRTDLELGLVASAVTLVDVRQAKDSSDLSSSVTLSNLHDLVSPPPSPSSSSSSSSSD